MSAVTDAPVDVERSQEELRVGVQKVETGRARLRKFVVTEQQTATVGVSHDELTITREPITDANRDQALEGAQITEAVHEVVLTEEHAVVEKEVVPVERVSLGTQSVQGTETVAAPVRKEEVELIDQRGVRTDVDSDPTS